MVEFKQGEKVTHPRVSGELTVISTRLVDGMLTADDGGNFSVADSERNFTLVQPTIRFGDRVRYVDQGDPKAAHIVTTFWDRTSEYVIRYGIGVSDWYKITEAEVLERRINE